MNLHSTRDAVLSEAVDRYIENRPKTQALHARAKEVMPGGNTRTVLYHPPFPIRVESAEGARITDVDGHQYIDFLGEYSAGIYGHSHSRIKQAIAEALSTGLNIGAHHGREIAFAETASRRFNLELVRFCNSGTEANMMALAAARCFTKRKKIMAFHGGYHGGTLYFTHGASPVNAPFDVVLAPYNDWAGTRQIIEKEADLAAVIIEPMQGGGGCIPADKEFLAKLRETTKRLGIVLVFDEVMTSRLGPAGLSAILGIEPDLKTLGKYIGGGMSFGAFGGRRDIMIQFDPSHPDALPHAGTFNNNTLTMTVGQAAMTEVFTPDACIALNARGDKLRNDLNELFMRYQAPMRATGLGSMIAIHPVNKDVHSVADADLADARLRQLLYLDLLEQGIYMADRGFIALSLMVSDEDCSKLLAALEKFVAVRKDVLKS
jgi:glutamate-1-semialdehyde 2,1-aminomutase